MSSPIRGGRRGHGRDAKEDGEKESVPKVRARDGKIAKTRLAKSAKDGSV
jgi:hypothetical protein